MHETLPAGPFQTDIPFQVYIYVPKLNQRAAYKLDVRRARCWKGFTLA